MAERLPYNAEYYEKAEVFKEDLWNASDQRRLETICSLIPEDVRTIVDIGSGRGFIVKAMSDQGFDVTATDSSEAALSQYEGRRVHCSCDDLPFDDCGFDMVTCTEVLEHLDDDLLGGAIREMTRVAKKYVLVSVPYREDLRASLMRCKACGAFFTTYGHIRSFSGNDMDDLLPGFRPIRRELGPERASYNRALLWIRQNIGRRWAYWRLAICPKCGAKPGRLGRRSLVACGCDFINNRIPWHPRSRSPIYVLYIRDNC